MFCGGGGWRRGIVEVCGGKVEHAAWKVESFQLKVERERREVEAVDGIRS